MRRESSSCSGRRRSALPRFGSATPRPRTICRGPGRLSQIWTLRCVGRCASEAILCEEPIVPAHCQCGIAGVPNDARRGECLALACRAGAHLHIDATEDGCQPGWGTSTYRRYRGWRVRSWYGVFLSLTKWTNSTTRASLTSRSEAARHSGGRSTRLNWSMGTCVVQFHRRHQAEAPTSYSSSMTRVALCG
jgi:hypothetical protein